LLELRQISTNFNKFWYADGKMADIVCYIYISTSPNIRHRTTLLNTYVPN